MSIRILGLPIIAIYPSLSNGWLRLFGKGISWKHERHGLRFSERYGYSKYVKIGPMIISYLP